MTVQFCSLASGSSGNCHYINGGEEYLLIDAGLSGKQIQNKLIEINVNPKKLTGILVSHEHSDHICGVGILSRKYDIPIYANEGTWTGMEEKIGKIQQNNIQRFSTDKLFSIGKFNILPYCISHDANDPVGFSFQSDGVKISITTDLGCVNEGILDNVSDSDLVVLESNHDIEMLKAGKYPYFLKRRILSDEGHLSNEAAGNTIVDLIKKNVKAVLLAHLSKENNFPELAYLTVKSILECNKLVVGKDINIELSYRDRISNMYAFSK